MPRPHPAFAAVYAGVAALGELTGYGRRRRDVLAGASGTLLVVGLGPGHDLAHLPPAVTSVVAVEPDSSMRSRSASRRAVAGVPVVLVGGVAEALPLAPACVDAVLLALVLCSVQDPARSAHELRRVLRPGGTVHVLEHVHAAHGSRLARWQDRVDPVWSRLAGGCHVNRDTGRVLTEAGFDTSALRRVDVPLSPPPVRSHLVGTARVLRAAR